MSSSQREFVIDDTSRLTSLDLYEDLLYNDSKQGKCYTIQEVHAEKKLLEEQNNSLHQQLALLQKEHGALKENFQSLLETAKSEIARKDKEITRLSCGALHQRVNHSLVSLATSKNTSFKVSNTADKQSATEIQDCNKSLECQRRKEHSSFRHSENPKEKSREFSRFDKPRKKSNTDRADLRHSIGKKHFSEHRQFSDEDQETSSRRSLGNKHFSERHHFNDEDLKPSSSRSYNSFSSRSNPCEDYRGKDLVRYSSRSSRRKSKNRRPTKQEDLQRKIQRYSSKGFRTSKELDGLQPLRRLADSSTDATWHNTAKHIPSKKEKTYQRAGISTSSAQRKSPCSRTKSHDDLSTSKCKSLAELQKRTHANDDKQIASVETSSFKPSVFYHVAHEALLLPTKSLADEPESFKRTSSPPETQTKALSLRESAARQSSKERQLDGRPSRKRKNSSLSETDKRCKNTCSTVQPFTHCHRQLRTAEQKTHFESVPTKQNAKSDEPHHEVSKNSPLDTHPKSRGNLSASKCMSLTESEKQTLFDDDKHTRSLDTSSSKPSSFHHVAQDRPSSATANLTNEPESSKKITRLPGTKANGPDVQESSTHKSPKDGQSDQHRSQKRDNSSSSETDKPCRNTLFPAKQSSDCPSELLTTEQKTHPKLTQTKPITERDELNHGVQRKSPLVRLPKSHEDLSTSKCKSSNESERRIHNNDDEHAGNLKTSTSKPSLFHHAEQDGSFLPIKNLTNEPGSFKNATIPPETKAKAPDLQVPTAYKSPQDPQSDQARCRKRNNSSTSETDKCSPDQPSNHSHRQLLLAEQKKHSKRSQTNVKQGKSHRGAAQKKSPLVSNPKLLGRFSMIKRKSSTEREKQAVGNVEPAKNLEASSSKPSLFSHIAQDRLLSPTRNLRDESESVKRTTKLPKTKVSAPDSQEPTVRKSSKKRHSDRRLSRKRYDSSPSETDEPCKNTQFPATPSSDCNRQLLTAEEKTHPKPTQTKQNTQRDELHHGTQRKSPLVKSYDNLSTCKFTSLSESEKRTHDSDDKHARTVETSSKQSHSHHIPQDKVLSPTNNLTDEPESSKKAIRLSETQANGSDLQESAIHKPLKDRHPKKDRVRSRKRNKPSTSETEKRCRNTHSPDQPPADCHSQLRTAEQKTTLAKQNIRRDELHQSIRIASNVEQGTHHKPTPGSPAPIAKPHKLDQISPLTPSKDSCQRLCCGSTCCLPLGLSQLPTSLDVITANPNVVSAEMNNVNPANQDQFSFVYFYRNASLQYLLHLADEELTKRRKLNDGASRNLWMKSLNKCQIRRKLNSRWLSERIEPEPSNSNIEVAHDTCLSADLHCSMTSSSWMHHEDSMRCFLEGLLKVVTPLKSDSQTTAYNELDNVSMPVKRRLLQSPLK